MRAIATPGHTASHISVLVHEDDAAVLLAGDASYTQNLMLAGKVDGVSPDATTARATLAAIKRFVAQQPTIYLPTHDPEFGHSARSADRRGRTGAHAAGRLTQTASRPLFLNPPAAACRRSRPR